MWGCEEPKPPNPMVSGFVGLVGTLFMEWINQKCSKEYNKLVETFWEKIFSKILDTESLQCSENICAEFLMLKSDVLSMRTFENSKIGKLKLGNLKIESL